MGGRGSASSCAPSRTHQVPLVLAAGAPGNEIQSPMAQVILGGLLTSTFLNLVVVPVLYLRSGRQR